MGSYKQLKNIRLFVDLVDEVKSTYVYKSNGSFLRLYLHSNKQ